jgi:hypothetical protein
VAALLIYLEEPDLVKQPVLLDLREEWIHQLVFCCDIVLLAFAKAY